MTNLIVTQKTNYLKTLSQDENKKSGHFQKKPTTRFTNTKIKNTFAFFENLSNNVSQNTSGIKSCYFAGNGNKENQFNKNVSDGVCLKDNNNNTQNNQMIVDITNIITDSSITKSQEKQIESKNLTIKKLRFSDNNEDTVTEKINEDDIFGTYLLNTDQYNKLLKENVSEYNLPDNAITDYLNNNLKNLSEKNIQDINKIIRKTIQKNRLPRYQLMIKNINELYEKFDNIKKTNNKDLLINFCTENFYFFIDGYLNELSNEKSDDNDINEIKSHIESKLIEEFPDKFIIPKFILDKSKDLLTNKENEEKHILSYEKLFTTIKNTHIKNEIEKFLLKNKDNIFKNNTKHMMDPKNSSFYLIVKETIDSFIKDNKNEILK